MSQAAQQTAPATADNVTDANEAMARTNLALVQKGLTEFDAISKGIGELAEKYRGVVFDVTTAAGMKEASTARAEIREPRYKTEHARKAAKAPLLALGKNIDQRAEFITTALLTLEEPIDAQIKAEEQRGEAERIEAARVISERIVATRKRIDTMARLPLEMMDASIADLQMEFDALVALTIGEDFKDFEDEAAAVKIATVDKLRSMIIAKQQTEAEAVKLKAEREEHARRQVEENARMAAERAALDKARADQEAKDRAAREKLEADERASRARIEEQERAARAAREEADREARQAREAEEKRIADERAKLKAEQDERDRVAREEREAAEAKARAEQEEAERLAKVERDRIEAEEREKKRQADELLDAAAMLATFKERFGHLPKYAKVVKAIDAALTATPKKGSEK